MARFVNYSVHTGDENMLIDEQLLESSIVNSLPFPVLRLYGWSPACVSLGRNQTSADINWDFCRNNFISFTKRLTGGRALLHDKELTYSFICPCSYLNDGESVQKSYEQISGAVMEGLKVVGINASFPEDKKIDTKHEYCMLISTKADLCYQGKKLVGSAQFRKQGYILQHGSILMNYDIGLLSNIFRENIDESKITALSKINQNIDLQTLCNAIKLGFERYFDTHFIGET